MKCPKHGIELEILGGAGYCGQCWIAGSQKAMREGKDLVKNPGVWNLSPPGYSGKGHYVKINAKGVTTTGWRGSIDEVRPKRTKRTQFY